MTITYTNAKALMATQATTLAGEATTAGLTSLATALTSLASEITSNNTEDWVGLYDNGLFSIYSQQLLSASNIIKTHIENNIKADLDTIATNSTTIATLASGTGIHFIGPYDWIGLISVYKLFIEQGKVLDTSQDISPEQLATAISIAEGYIAKLRSLPTLY